MSVQFSDTTNFRGLVQLYERELGFERTFVSGNTNRLKEFTADCNLALDDFTALALQSSGTWQWDDSNQTDYPIITANLTDGRRNYAFTIDGSSNLILDIYRVFVYPSATSTTYQEIFPIDQQSDRPGETSGFWDGQNTEGVPYRYDKTANAIFLDPIPSYNSTDGLKMMINREAFYFVSTDTTKKPGVPGLYHDYFFLKPALMYARRNNLAKERKLKEAVLEIERAAVEYYGKRERDVRDQLVPEPISYL